MVFLALTSAPVPTRTGCGHTTCADAQAPHAEGPHCGHLIKTATKIQIPRPDDASNQIRITGTKEGIEKARHEVLLISAEQVRPACACAARVSVWV